MRRALARASCLVLGAVALGACGTYYDPGDSYTRGLRLFDRGQFANAILFWKPLAEAGDCDAAYRYGVLFALGAGVPKDLEVARDWWTKAANQGNYRAQLMLAMVYGHRSFTTGSFIRQFTIDCRQGCGVARDPLAASQWLGLARELWPRDAETAQQYLELEIIALDVELTADQKAEVQRWIRSWVPTPTRCTPRVIL